MKYFQSSVCVVILAFSFITCGNGGKASFVRAGGDTLCMKYAENLRVVRYSDYTVAVLRNPWDTLKTLRTYVLVDRQDSLPERMPENAMVVRIPLERCMVYSSVHCSLFNELGALRRIAGICGLEYMNVPEIKEGCRNGSIVDCGNSLNPDVERIIDLHPDAILLSPFENNDGYGKLGKLGIPLVECADYMETSPLGRAEWMRFYGLLTGTSGRADSLFREVEKEYLRVKELAARSEKRPTVISDLKYGSVWYISGGGSTTGKLFADAGADYVFSDVKNSGSVPMAFETVFDKGQLADCWLIKYNHPEDKTYRALAAEYAPYSRFQAFRERRIYGCNTYRIPYYEETPFHPDRLLKDMVKIFHPELLGDYQTRYFMKLEE